MRSHVGHPSPATAILTLAEIKAATEAFDRGESDVFHALDAIIVAVEAHQAMAAGAARREGRRREAA